MFWPAFSHSVLSYNLKRGEQLRSEHIGCDFLNGAVTPLTRPKIYPYFVIEPVFVTEDNMSNFMSKGKSLKIPW
jgi:hypothetical protein